MKDILLCNDYSILFSVFFIIISYYCIQGQLLDVKKAKQKSSES